MESVNYGELETSGHVGLIEEKPRSTFTRKKKATINSYIDKYKHGETPRDDSDLSDDDQKFTDCIDATPRTRRNILQEAETTDIKKLGPWATAFTLFKGFVATGILYMPKNFVNGGWAFSALSLTVSLFLTMFCIHLLLQVREKVGGSFSEIGAKTYGKCGKIAVDITLFGS